MTSTTHTANTSVTHTTGRRKLLAAAGSLAAAGLVGLTGGAAQAQGTAFPNKPVRIVPFGAGGGPIDGIARVFGDKLTQLWGQPMVIETRPGASGIIAADYVAKSPADGYTVMLTLPLTHVNNAILMPKLPYHAVKDFTPLSIVGTGGPMLVARADAPYNNVREFIEFAKKQPQGVTYGTWGNGSGAHLFGELLKRQSGTNLIHTAYKAEAPSHMDMFGKTLDIAWANPASARAHIQAGKMKAIGATGTRRLSILPDVPTFTEQGYKGFDLDSWLGFYGPANMPPAVQQAWVTALNQIVAMPDVAARLVSYGFEPLVSSPEQFKEVYQRDTPRTAELIKDAGVTAP